MQHACHVISHSVPIAAHRSPGLAGWLRDTGPERWDEGQGRHGMGCGVDRLAPPQRNGNFAPQKPQEIDTEHLQTSAVAVIIIVTVSCVSVTCGWGFPKRTILVIDERLGIITVRIEWSKRNSCASNPIHLYARTQRIYPPQSEPPKRNKIQKQTPPKVFHPNAKRWCCIFLQFYPSDTIPLTLIDNHQLSL